MSRSVTVGFVCCVVLMFAATANSYAAPCSVPPAAGEICYDGENYGTLQSALTACPPGGTVELGSGDINISGTVYMYGEKIVGQGKGVTTIKCPSQSWCIYANTTADGYGATLEDLSIESWNYYWAGAVVYQIDPDGMVLKNVSINALQETTAPPLYPVAVIRTGYYGAHTSGDITIDNCDLEGFSTVVRVDSTLTGGAKLTIKDSTILAKKAGYAIDVANNVSVDLRNNDITHLGTGANYAGVYHSATAASRLDMSMTYVSNSVYVASGWGLVAGHSFAPSAGQNLDVLVQDNDIVVGRLDGISVATASAFSTKLRVLNNTVTGVSGPLVQARAGIVASRGDLEVRGNTVRNIDGRGINVPVAAAPPVVVLISDNTVEDVTGYGIYVYNYLGAPGRVEGNRIARATTDGIFYYHSKGLGVRGVVADNIVSDSYRGIYTYRDVDIVNNTIVRSSYYDLWTYDGDSAVVNNIFHDSALFAWLRQTTTVANNIVNSPAGSGPDPLLDAGFELQTGSPAIDAGDATYGALAGAGDFNGTPRVVGPAIDIGAQEVLPPATLYRTVGSGTWGDGNWVDAGAIAYSEPRPVDSAHVGADVAGVAVAEVTIPAPSASLQDLFLGYSSDGVNDGEDGTLILADNTALSVLNDLRFGYYKKIGKGHLTMGNNSSIAVANDLWINNSVIAVNGDQLSVGNDLNLGGVSWNYQVQKFIQDGGTMNVGGNLHMTRNIREHSTVQLMNNAVLNVAGKLQTCLANYNSQTYTLDIDPGSVLNIGQSLYHVTADFTYQGDDITIGDSILVAGNGGYSTRLYQDGGRVVADSLLITYGYYRINSEFHMLNNATLSLRRPSSGDVESWVGKSGHISRGGGNSAYLYLGTATDPGTIDTEGSGGGTLSLTIYKYSTKNANSDVFLRGWGLVALDGTLENNAQVIADGYGTDRDLLMPVFSSVTQNEIHPNNVLFDFWLADGSRPGWYAVNGGRLVLPMITGVGANDAVRWGDTINDLALDYKDLVNSMMLDFDGVNGGDLDITLLASDRADSRVREPDTVIGVWNIDDSLFDMGSGGSVQLTIRYDEVLASDKGLDETQLKIWRFDETLGWQDVTDSVDTGNKLITTIALPGMSTFAVSTANPAPAVILYRNIVSGTWDDGTWVDVSLNTYSEPWAIDTAIVGSYVTPGILVATVTIEDPGAMANNVYLGHCSGVAYPVGTLVLEDDTDLTITDTLRVGDQRRGVGNVVFGANTHISMANLEIDRSTLTYVGGSLTITDNAYIGASYCNQGDAYLVQDGGVQSVGGNVYVGTGVGGSTDRGYLELTDGAELDVVGNLYVGATSGRGKGDLQMEAGTSLSAENLHVQNLVYGTITIDGDAVTIADLLAVGKYQTGYTELVQDGGTLVASRFEIGNGDRSASDHGVYYLNNNATLLLARPASGNQDNYIQRSPVRNPSKATVYLGDASTPGTIAVAGAGSGTHSLWLQRYKNKDDAEGNLIGWGSVAMAGTLHNNGRVIADGYGTDRSLDMSSFGVVKQEYDNRGECGWFAVNGGKVELPDLTGIAGGDTVVWGDTATDTTLDAADPYNSLAGLFSAGVIGGDLSIALLASDRADSGVTAPATVIGVWDVDSSGFDMGSGTVQLSMRYDDVLAASKALNEADLKVWRYTDCWEEVPSTVDTANNVITTDPMTALSIFAVSTEIPGESCNEPPDAVCQNVTITLGAGGTYTMAASEVDGGSTDPDGDTLLLSVDKTDFSCSDRPSVVVTLTVDDQNGETDTCTATVTVLPPVPVSGDASWVSQQDGGWSDSCNWSPVGTVPNASGDIALLTSTGSGGPDSVRNIQLTEDITVGYVDFAQGGSGDRYYIQSATDNALIFDDPSGKAKLYSGYYGGGSHYIYTPVKINTLLEARCRWGRMTLRGPVTGTTANPDVTIDSLGYVSGASITLINKDNDLGAGTLNVRAPVASRPGGINLNSGTVSGDAGVVDADDTVNLHGGLAQTSLGLYGWNTVNWGIDINVLGSPSRISVSRAASGDVNGLMKIGSLTLSPGVTLAGGAGVGYDLGISDGEALTLGSGSSFNWVDDFWTGFIGDIRILAGAVLQGDGAITIDKHTLHGGVPDAEVRVHSDATMAPGIGAGNTGIISISDLRTPRKAGTYALELLAGSTLEIDINAAGAGTGHDQVVVNSTVFIAGNLVVNSPEGACPPQGDYVIIDNDGTDAVVGTFAGLAEGATVVDDEGLEYTISYVGGAGGNDVVLTGPVDVTDPVAVCQDISVALVAPGTASITGDDVDGGSSDNCGIVSKEVSPSSFDCDDIGDNTVVLTVTDGDGNTATCEATVTVTDDVNSDTPVVYDLDADGTEVASSQGNHQYSYTGFLDDGDLGSYKNGNIIDGMTRKHEYDYMLSRGKNPTWVTMKLGQPRVINEIVLDHHEYDGHAAALSYRVQYSTDAVNGLTDGTWSDVPAAAYTGTMVHDEVVDIPLDYPIVARFVRIRLARVSGSSRITLNEVTLIGGDALGDACDECPDVPGDLPNGCPSPVDSDGDTVPDASDNCPDDQNSDQADGDSDGVGDVCDNCPEDANADQANGDTGQQFDLVTDGTLVASSAGYHYSTGLTGFVGPNLNTGTTDQYHPGNFIDGTKGGSTFHYFMANSTTRLTVKMPEERVVYKIVLDQNNAASHANIIGYSLSYSEDGVLYTAVPSDDASGAMEHDTVKEIQLDAAVAAQYIQVYMWRIWGARNTMNEIEVLTGDPLGDVCDACPDEAGVLPDGCNNQPPVAVCQDVTVSANSACLADASIDNGSYDPDGDVLTYEQDPDGPYVLGDTDVVLTVSDPRGLTSSCEATVTVIDERDPTIDCPDDATVECTGSTAPTATGTPTVDDNCSVKSTKYVDDVDDSGCGDTVVITRTWTVTDGSDNTASCDQVITVVDTTDPTIDCPDDATLECDGAGNVDDIAGWLASVTADDTCGGVDIDDDYAGLSDDCGATGSATVTFTATDDCGNTSECSATVTVVDTTDPDISCPADATLECDGAGNVDQIADWLASVGASDGCGGVDIDDDYVALSDDCGATGSATVTFTATDDCGNTSACSATVTVVDTTDPDISCPADATLECDGAGNVDQIADWLASVTAGDTCGGVEIDDDYNGLSDDCGATGSATVTFTATDDCGNTSECSATVTVEDTTDPDIVCPADATLECDGAGNVDQIAAWLASVTASDVCGGVTIVNDYAGISADCGATGGATVTFTATDDCGNTSECSATVTVEDITDPEIACSAAPPVSDSGDDDDDDYGKNAVQIAFGASDVCGNVTVTASLDIPCLAGGDDDDDDGLDVLPVYDGQIIEVKCNAGNCDVKWKGKDKSRLEIHSAKGPVILHVIAVDDCGNTSECLLDLCPPKGDDDDDM